MLLSVNGGLFLKELAEEELMFNGLLRDTRWYISNGCSLNECVKGLNRPLDRPREGTEGNECIVQMGKIGAIRRKERGSLAG